MRISTTRLAFSIFALCFTLAGCKSPVPESRLIGTWQYDDESGQRRMISFSRDGSLIFKDANRPTLNQNLAQSDIVFKYLVDTTQKPKHIDFITYNIKKAQEVIRMKGVYRMVSDSTIQWVFHKGTNAVLRPTAFHDSLAVTLTKTPTTSF